MKTQKRLSDYFNTNNTQDDVVIENNLFLFNRFTIHNDGSYGVTVLLNYGETVYTATQTQFEAFVEDNCTIDQLESKVAQYMNEGEFRSYQEVVPKVSQESSVGLFNDDEDPKKGAKTEVEAILEANKTDILSAVKSFFANEEKKEINIADLVAQAPSFVFKEQKSDGSTVEITRPGGVTTMSYINGNVVLSKSTVITYTDVLKNKGETITFLYAFRDKRFQELFFKQVLKSTSIGLSLGFNFSALSPKIPTVPTEIKQDGKAKPKNGGNDFNMDLNFAQQKFEQVLKLRRDFLTINEPVMMFSNDLETNALKIYNIKEQKQLAEEALNEL